MSHRQTSTQDQQDPPAQDHPIAVLGSRAIPMVSVIIMVILLIAVEIVAMDPAAFKATPFLLGDDEAELKQIVVKIAQIMIHDFPIIFMSQVTTISTLMVYALIPGLLGLIYRRAFWQWFIGAFSVGYGIHWSYLASETGSITPKLYQSLQDTWTEPTFLLMEIVLVNTILFFRLQRYSSSVISTRIKLTNIAFSIFFIGLGIGWIILTRKITGSIAWWELGVIFFCFMVGAMTLRQTLRFSRSHKAKIKNIVICIDGTWNEPGTTDFGYFAETNVLKLFKMLKGCRPQEPYSASEAKVEIDEQGQEKQMAFYYHGVGNKHENNQIEQVFGGMFGLGASAIVERAYLDIAQVYRPGDRIFIFGFSRGAAIARILAGVLGRRGIPRSLWTLRLFGFRWPVWKSSDLVKTIPENGDSGNPPLPGAKGVEVHKRARQDTDVSIEVLGCWDTVGSFGVSKNIAGIPFQSVNLLKDLSVSLSVKRAYHMVALDETRDAFEPTLMEPDPICADRIIEVWFSGNHSNVGGGYATDKLSNVTLDFLLRHTSSGYAWREGMTPGDEQWGLYLSAIKFGLHDHLPETALHRVSVIDPDPLGRIRQSTGIVYSHKPRELPPHAIIYDDVFTRMRDVVPVYAPQSLFDLNKNLMIKREDIAKEAERLVRTQSLDKEEYERICRWGNEKLSILKWSRYLEQTSENTNRYRPEVELAHSLPG